MLETLGFCCGGDDSVGDGECGGDGCPDGIAIAPAPAAPPLAGLLWLVPTVRTGSKKRH